MFVPVTLVDNPPEDSRLVQEEQFGPILPLLKWVDEADVVRRASTFFDTSTQPKHGAVFMLDFT